MTRVIDAQKQYQQSSGRPQKTWIERASHENLSSGIPYQDNLQCLSSRDFILGVLHV